MENFYLILIVVLFALAFSDLIVGVSNDAVNFLNSAIGSKAAPKWLIFLVAGIGVLVGATFSSGMMEVARKGIFHPDMFFFSEIMIIFIAVMITDVILLDMFNTFGLPTSTTVSIVFELLGSAVAVALVKLNRAGESLGELSHYINSGKALAIISGILLSVFVAFIVGAVVQYISRLVFTFSLNKTLKYYGALFGGLAIAAMTYFMIIKGAKGASFMSTDTVNFLKSNMVNIILLSIVGWTILLQLLNWIFNIDIPKIIVLVGTFGLAMAFAGNDLVNFIGVPLAGFHSYNAWIASGSSPDLFEMSMLSGKVVTPTYMLLIAGLVMTVTLILSRKARSVVATTVDLSRQDEGDERFGSSAFSRIVVRNAINFNKGLINIIGSRASARINNRFINTQDFQDPNRPAFDKIRASVNLIVAGILISIGTSLKLPLSTTYVTFMVAMGTSLADRAWDRESAVYRVSGVFTVIGGWFLTAIIAFSVSGFIAWMISIGGSIMFFIFSGIAVLMVIRTSFIFKKRSAKTDEDDEEISTTSVTDEVLDKCKGQVVKAIISSNQIYTVSVESFLNEDRSRLHESYELNKEFNKKSKKLKSKILGTIAKLQQDSVDSGHYYVQVIDYRREMAHSINYIVVPLLEHLENNHKPFLKEQNDEFVHFISEIDAFFNFVLHQVKEKYFENLDEVISKRDELIEKLTKLEKTQIKRIKNKEVNTRNSMVYFKLISETKNLLHHTVNMVKAQRDFFINSQNEIEK